MDDWDPEFVARSRPRGASFALTTWESANQAARHPIRFGNGDGTLLLDALGIGAVDLLVVSRWLYRADGGDNLA
jgi:hypothetical protein